MSKHGYRRYEYMNIIRIFFLASRCISHIASRMLRHFLSTLSAEFWNYYVSNGGTQLALREQENYNIKYYISMSGNGTIITIVRLCPCDATDLIKIFYLKKIISLDQANVESIDGKQKDLTIGFIIYTEINGIRSRL